MTDRVVKATLKPAIEVAFRKADSFNTLRTYPIPPVTTTRGMIYAALGRHTLLNQGSKPYRYSNDLGDDRAKEIVERERDFRERFEEETRISVQAPETGITKTDLRNRMKVGRSDDERQYKTYVAQEETIINPEYQIYIGSESASVLETVNEALEEPERLLYLGRSDDIVCVENVDVQTVQAATLPEDRQVFAPGSDGEEPFLLPVESDYKGTYTTRPSSSVMLSVQSEHDECLVTEDGDYFVFFD